MLAGQFDEEDAGTKAEIAAVIRKVRATAPIPAAPVTQHSAEEAYARVLGQAGATLPKRDPVDVRVVNMVRAGKCARGNGIIDLPQDVGGWPEYASSPAPVDSDHDGMPDQWEEMYGLNSGDPSDAAGDTDDDGYTNIEEYLNGTDPTQFIDYRDPQNNWNTLSG